MSALGKTRKGTDMVIKINGKAAAPAAKTPAPTPAADAEQVNLDGLGAQTPNTPVEEKPATAAAPLAAATAPAAGAVKFAAQAPAAHLMQGAGQNTAVEQVKVVQELRAKLRSGAREFWLNEGSFAKLYFLDGTLLSKSVFDTPLVATHLVQLGGDWTKIICNKNTEGSCIVCDSHGQSSSPDTMQLFTVINTMPYTIQNGKNKGTVLPARLQLFGATLKARGILEKRAENNNNTLAGKLIQFSRSTKQDPRTGNDIEVLAEYPMAAVLQKYAGLGDPDANGKATATQPFNYATAYPILTNAEIAAMRPDLAHAAGYQGAGPVAAATAFTGGDPTAALDDEIPF